MKKSFGVSVLKIMASALNWLTSSLLRAFIFIFILAFGIRASRNELYVLPSPERELGAIARALVDTGQFANPYMLETGPTAHLPPVPPMIVALIYCLFENTWQAGYVFAGFMFMTSSLIYALMPWIADRLGAGRQAGFVGGLMGAFMVELDWPTHGEGLAAILLGLMLVAFMKRWSNERNSLFSSLILGLGIGASFHVQPVLLLVFLGCFAFEIGWRRLNRKFVMTGMLALGVLLASAPWAWRNYAVFHEFFFIRSNLGLELRMGNSPGAAATFEEMDRQGRIYKHPRATIEEARKVQQWGEMEYMHRALVDALVWMKENPVEFLKLTVLRFTHFWFGPLNRSFTSILVAALTILAILGARQILPNLPLPQRILILTPLITYPLIYYLVAFMPSYRTPIDWMLFLLAGIEILGWFDSQKRDWIIRLSRKEFDMSKNISSTLLVITLCILGGINLAGCSSGNVAPPDVVDTWKPPEGIDAASPVSCEKNHSLFAYDEDAPLDIREVSRRREEGVTVIDLSYASPKGGRVPATLVVPDGSGPFAGMIYQHGMPATRQHLIPGAVIYARMGAVVILIDAPFARPEHGSAEPLMFTEQDRREQIQLIVDLRRAVDLLLSRSDVDPKRLAYVGISYGGAMGGLLAGIENRIKGYVLQVGDGGLVTHFTGVEDRDWWQAKPEEVRRQWVAWMWLIEPIHYVTCASPAELLFQNGTLDKMVPPADAMQYQNAGSEPKTILWYENGHGLGVAAGRDQAEWLSKIIGIANHRPLPRSVQIVLNAWFILVTGSLAIITWTLWRTRSVAYGDPLMWLLTTAFLGPLGLSIYWISKRSPQGTKESIAQRSIFRRSLGSAAWASTGNMLGGIGVIALLLYLPGIFGAYLALQITAVFFLPFCAGWLVFAISQWISHTDASYALSYRRSMFAEAVSTCWVLAGVYPTVTIINGLTIERWTVPFGFDLSYPPLWAVLCLAVFVGTLTALPFHLWMIRRGEIRWGYTNPPDEINSKGLPWYWQISLLIASFAVMLGTIFLSMQIA